MKLKKVLIVVILFSLLIGLVSNVTLAVVNPSTITGNNSRGINPSDLSVNSNTSEIKSASSNIIAIIIACVFGFILYVIPMCIALKRKHPQRFPIGCLNIFLGWTFLGWVICLVWSLSNTKSEVQISSNKYEDLARLQELKNNGTITETEFEVEKTKLLR